MSYYNYKPYDREPYNFSKNREPNNLGFYPTDYFKDVNVNKIKGDLLDNIYHYNKNLTDDEINGTNVNNILKYNNLLTLGQFDKMLIADQYERLYNMSRTTNDITQQEVEESRFINMPISQILANFSKTWIDIINEIPSAFKRDYINWEIFTKEDRLTYVGLLFFILSFLIYFIYLSS